MGINTAGSLTILVTGGNQGFAKRKPIYTYSVKNAEINSARLDGMPTQYRTTELSLRCSILLIREFHYRNKQ